VATVAEMSVDMVAQVRTQAFRVQQWVTLVVEVVDPITEQQEQERLLTAVRTVLQVLAYLRVFLEP
jgi:hypothetical protein